MLPALSVNCAIHRPYLVRQHSATSTFSHQMLLNRIELQLPKDDHVKYDSRARKLDWDQIKFKDYSAEDCKKYWEHIQVAQDT